MTLLGIYRCKQCHAVFNIATFGNLSRSTAEKIFEKTKTVNVFISGEVPIEIVTHRCDPVTAGECERIGWRKIE